MRRQSRWWRSAAPLLLVVLLMAMVSGCGAENFKSGGSPAIHGARALALQSASAGWAVGDGGALWRFDGTVWQRIASSPTAHTLRALVLDHAGNGWAVGDGVILQLSQGTWTSAHDPSGAVLLGVGLVPGTDEAWAVGADATILHETNGTWQMHSQPTFHLPPAAGPQEPGRMPTPVVPAHPALRSVSFVSAGDGWAVGDYNWIVHYQDGIWQQAREDYYGNQPLTQVGMLSTEAGWAVGGRGVLRYRQGQWSDEGNAPAQNVAGLAIYSPSDVWAYGSSVQYYDGTTWHGMIFPPDPSAPPESQVLDMALTGPTAGWVITVRQQPGSSSETTFTHFEYSLGYFVGTGALSGVQMRSKTDGWAVGEQGVLHFDGIHWRPAFQDGLHGFAAIAMTSATEGWAVGEPGTNTSALAHDHNGQWTLVQSPISAGLAAVSVRPDGEGMAVGQSGAILRLHAGQWTPLPRLVDEYLSGVALTADCEGWAIGASGTLLRYSGCQWSVYRKVSAGGLYGLAMLSASDGWAVGDNGSAYHFIDGDWRQVAMPVSDRLLGIAVVSSHEAWAVSEQGNILHYTPEGWSLVKNGWQGPRLLAVSALPDGTAWAVGEQATILPLTPGQ